MVLQSIMLLLQQLKHLAAVGATMTALLLEALPV
jgi:hypothetical protein